MNKKWLNIPLLVFFGLCYGLGHPSAASYRPASIEKSLTGFHVETNRLALGFYGMFVHATEEKEAPVVRIANKPVMPEPAMAPPPPKPVDMSRGLSEPPRIAQQGFIVLSAR